MTRPRCCYKIKFCPKIRCFKPEGVPADKIKTVLLTPEEAEALRLKNIKDLDQTKAAEEMHISQSSFQRILSSAYKKVSTALIEGKAITIVEQETITKE